MNIDAHATIKETLVKMKEKKASYLLVTDEKENIIGSFTWQHIIDFYIDDIDMSTSLDQITLQEVNMDHHEIIDESDVTTHEAFSEKGVGEGDDRVVPNIDYVTDNLKQMLHIKDTAQHHLVDLLPVLHERLEIYYKTLENMPLSIFISNADGEVVYLNKKFENTTGVDRNQLLGKKFSYVEQLNLFWPTITPIIFHEKRQVSITQKIIKNGLKTVVTGIPIFDQEQNIQWVVTASRELQKDEWQADNKSFVTTHKLKNNTLLFKSKEMKEIFHLTKQIAAVLSTVLITGESGVGKDAIAELIHEQSDRHEQPFMHINCGAIPEALLESELFGYETGAFSGASKEGKEGLIEAANHGTLFLDEIGEMPLNLQVKLLQVLQNKRFTRVGGTQFIEVDIRIIAATNANLLELVEEGKFRLDLFYRLNVVPIHIPPLRERIEDIVPLANLFLKTYTKKYKKDLQATLEFEEGLLKYSWPGNIRELDNLIERLVVTTKGRFIDQHSLSDNVFVHPSSREESINRNIDPSGTKPILVQQIVPLKRALNHVEDQLTNLAYTQTKNSYKVAELLEISQSSAHRKIQKYVE